MVRTSGGRSKKLVCSYLWSSSMPESFLGKDVGLSIDLPIVVSIVKSILIVAIEEYRTEE